MRRSCARSDRKSLLGTISERLRAVAPRTAALCNRRYFGRQPKSLTTKPSLITFPQVNRIRLITFIIAPPPQTCQAVSYIFFVIIFTHEKASAFRGFYTLRVGLFVSTSQLFYLAFFSRREQSERYNGHVVLGRSYYFESTL